MKPFITKLFAWWKFLPFRKNIKMSFSSQSLMSRELFSPGKFHFTETSNFISVLWNFGDNLKRKISYIVVDIDGCILPMLRHILVLFAHLAEIKFLSKYFMREEIWANTSAVSIGNAWLDGVDKEGWKEVMRSVRKFCNVVFQFHAPPRV